MPAGWSGHPNGQIPLSMLTQLSPILGSGGYAQTDAANAFRRMAAEFEAAVGTPLKFSEAYRSYETQVQLFTERYVRVNYNTGIYWDGSYWKIKPGVAAAAIPGRSNHGEALAFDFAWPLTSWSTQGQQWFRANEARFGFSSAQGVADGEPWHKVYVGPTPTVSGGGAVIIEQEAEEDMSTTPIVADVTKPAWGLGVPGWTYLRDDATGIFRALSSRETDAYIKAHPQTWANRVIWDPKVVDDEIRRTGIWEYTGDAKTGPRALTGRIIGRAADRNNQDGSPDNVRHFPHTQQPSNLNPI